MGRLEQPPRARGGAGGRRGGPRRTGVVALAGIAFLLIAGGRAGAAENLERLFFTPLERQTLDELRAQGEGEPPTPSGEPREAPVVEVISFDGKVERSDGTSTVWVNGRAVTTGNRTVEGIRVESTRGTAGETRFELPSSRSSSGEEQAPPRFTLKAGQKVAVQDGRKFDTYETRPEEDAETVFDEQEAAEPAADAAREPLPEPPAGTGNADPASGS